MPALGGSSPLSVPALERELIEKEILQGELRQLRESTKQALQESWDEVEQLERQATERDALNLTLEAALAEARDSGERWRIQFEEQRSMVMELSRREAQFKSLHLKSLFIDGPMGKLKEELSVALTEDCTAESLESSLCTNQRPLDDDESDPKDGGRRDGWIGLRGLIDGRWMTNNMEREKSESERNRILASLEEEKDATIAELVFKLRGRDSAISSLEKTAELQGQTVQELRKEMDTKTGEWSQREKAMKAEIDKLKKSTREKKKIISDQANRMVEYQEYISALTDELEVMCKDTPGDMSE